MVNTSNTQPISLCFVGLPLADQATFERVISFCKARGQHFDITLNPSEADVLITGDESNNLKTARQLLNKSLLLVVSDKKDCSEGDVQLQRPLLVTRVMRTMESLTGKLANLEKTTESVTPASSATRAAVIAEEPAAQVSNETTTETEPAAIEASNTEETAVNETPKSDYLALVIDDSSAIRKQLEIELRTAGISCEFAESGEQALDKIKDTDFDLVFLDIMMPGIDGYETCGKLRRDPRYKKTPVVMLSGKTAPLDEVKGVIAGASTYLTKPVKSDQFQRVTGRITRWLDEFR